MRVVRPGAFQRQAEFPGTTLHAVLHFAGKAQAGTAGGADLAGGFVDALAEGAFGCGWHLVRAIRAGFILQSDQLPQNQCCQ